MGEFVSNVAKLLDEAQMRKFNEGIQQGKEQAILEIAQRMIIEGAEDIFIAKVTGLSFEKIQELRKKSTGVGKVRWQISNVQELATGSSQATCGFLLFRKEFLLLKDHRTAEFRLLAEDSEALHHRKAQTCRR